LFVLKINLDSFHWVGNDLGYFFTLSLFLKIWKAAAAAAVIYSAGNLWYIARSVRLYTKLNAIDLE